MKRVVIIGGGISGLAAAHRLLERNRESGKRVAVTILEAGSRPGGIVQTRERDGFLLESGPDSFISEKPAALALVKRLGLESHLIETNLHHRRSFIVREGRLRPVPEGFHLLAPSRLWPFIKSDIFSWSGKARMALDLLLPRRELNGTNVRNSAEESLAEFVRRRLGTEALERMAQAMVGGIYTADPERLSLQATMPRFLEMEREHRSLIRALRKQNSRKVSANNQSEASGARYSLFLSFDRGMQVLTDTLEGRISSFGSQTSTGAASGQASIRVNSAVESITLEYGAGECSPKWKITTSGSETLFADAICLALPAYVSSRLLGGVDPQLATALAEISYASSATINLGFKRDDISHPLDGFGFVVPFIENRSLIACTFSSVKFAGRAPQGHALLRAFVGGALQPELLELNEGELLARVLRDLRDLLGIDRAPLFAEVTKWERSMPQYHVGHLERVKRIEARLAALPGLVLAGNAYSGLGIPDCIRSGEAAAHSIDED
ncbi:MAG TPA: protoporphyrinogen oxidase [Pyrinomonadaceae bacterium]|nr:protoporphyrinogen oxidase [Pyrinomonadaceae bacterium]